jgi:hypothetical protein
VDDLRWREALQRAGGADNPDHLWPVQASGFSDLLARKGAQDEAMAQHAQRLDALVDAARQLARKQETAQAMEGLAAAKDSRFGSSSLTFQAAGSRASVAWRQGL